MYADDGSAGRLHFEGLIDAFKKISEWRVKRAFR